MTKEDAYERYGEIMACIRDYERAHSLEDEFHRDVLKSILNGSVNKKEQDEIILIALSTQKLNFPRYCA